MKRKNSTKVLAVLLTLVMIFSAIPATVIAAVGEFTAPSGMYTISNTKRQIAPGVTENKIVTNKTSGNEQVQGYAVTVDLQSGSKNTFAVGYADYQGSQWKMQTVRNQAAAFEKKTGKNVVAAFNADGFNMNTGEPMNCLRMNSVTYKAGLGMPYFAIMNDGTARIGERMTQDVLDNCKEAVGSGFGVLVLNGKKTSQAYHGVLHPRTTLGIKANGDVVMYVADGRQAPTSVGLDTYDLADIMIGLGCVDVLNFDGGGSATYAAQYEGSDSLVVSNKPSDGVERTVASSIFVVSDAKPTGEFDHASLQPNDLLYTPNSEVQFAATGVDSAGGSAQLPSNGRFALADNSFGTIDADGKFISNGKTGTVTVNYVVGNEVFGSTEIGIVSPDSISFSSEEVSLGFSKESTLGLIVRYKSRDVKYKAGDIVWSLSDERLGSFNGNVFTSSDSETVNGTITATSAFDSRVSGSVSAIIGRLPKVAMDFENKTDDEGNALLAKDYWTFANGYCEPGGGKITQIFGEGRCLAATYNRRGVAQASIVNIDDNEPVRFGANSLKVHYDFSQVKNETEGACVGFIDAMQQVEGTPTAMGLWVYAPEDTPNLWLRIRVKDGTGTVQTTNFTESSGIDWNGWKYVEADLTKFQGPFSLIGGETIRIMYCPATKSGFKAFVSNNADGTANMRDIPQTDCKGDLYIDNLQFVYGANVDDIDNPIISSITANGKEIENGAVYNTNEISFDAYYEDIQNRYTSGIDSDTVRIYLDGNNITDDDNTIVVDSDQVTHVYNAELANGTHEIQVSVRDKFGNEVSESRTFKVNGENTYPTAWIESEVGEGIFLGGEHSLNIVTNNINDVQSLSVNVAIDRSFDDFTVNYADGFDGSYDYNAKTGVISLKVNRISDAVMARRALLNGTVASIVFNIPTDLTSGKQFTFSATSGKVVFSGTQNSTKDLFYCEKTREDIVAPLVAEVAPMVVGLDGTITVKDNDGNAVADAAIILNGVEIGVTDENGQLTTNLLKNGIQNYAISVRKGTDVSFPVTGQSVNAGLNAEGKPEYVLSNAAKTSESMKNITWLSNPVATDEKAVIMFAEKSEYDKLGDLAFETAEGMSKLRQFLGSAQIENNYAARVNSVVLSGLKRNTEYVYKVGDGNIFSELRTFTTKVLGTETNFFVLGDTQVEDKENVNQIIDTLGADGTKYDFAIQTGDSIESAAVYKDWVDILNVFSDDYLSNVDFIHVLGNHEYMGDLTGEASNDIYNLPNEHYYSVNYGNVYVAVINYTNGGASELKEALDWLKTDAANSNAQWKVLTMHQPPYYTNTTGNNEYIKEMVPPVAEEAGIDFVFSGHDHSYARSLPLTDGKVDEENGVTYYICGSTGGKSYGILIDDKEKENFGFLDDQFTALYLTVKATETDFTVTAREHDGSIIDSFTMKAHHDCLTNGHKYIMSNDGYLTCKECAYTIPVDGYTGFAVNGDNGKTMYIIGGKVKTGWMVIGDDAYYFGEDGCAATGENVTIDGVSGYNFDKDGKQIDAAFVTDAKGVTRAYRGGQLIKGWWTNSEGDIYYFSRSDGAMRRGETTITFRTNQKLDVVFSEDGKLLKGALYETEDGTVYYWGSEMVSGWWEIDGSKYYFDPDTHYMAVGNATIDGKEYAFSQYGSLVHEGFHTYADMDIVTMDPNCTIDGKILHICTKCFVPIEEKIPALGHVDKNNDGKCDRCGDSTEKNKPSTIEEILYNLFARIIAFYRNLSNLIKNGFKQIGK